MPPILILAWALGQLGFSSKPQTLVAENIDGPASIWYKPAGGGWDSIGFVPGPFVHFSYHLDKGATKEDSVRYVFPDPIAWAVQRQALDPLPYPADNDPLRLSPHLRKAAIEFGWDFARRKIQTGAPMPQLVARIHQTTLAQPAPSANVIWTPRPAGGRLPKDWQPQPSHALSKTKLHDGDPEKPFYLSVNGKAQFLLGVNAIVPHSPVQENALRKRLIQMHRSGGNTVRFWAGGYYPSERLLHTCDSLGLMVWQDFAFTGTTYPGDSLFLHWVTVEATQQVQRMAQHPCIVLFCGNNEIDVAWRAWGWQHTYAMTPEDSARMAQGLQYLFHELLPGIVQTYAPDRAYLASSPISNWGRPEDFKVGDNHDWRVWHGEQPSQILTHTVAPMVTEWGVPSLPNAGVQSRWTEEPAAYMLSYKGLGLLERYLTSENGWRPDGSTRQLTRQSQKWQAAVVRRTLRAHAAARPFCSGTLIWQLNDMDDVISWSLIDADDSPKKAWKTLLHEFQKF
jgi:hypothetical protein